MRVEDSSSRNHLLELPVYDLELSSIYRLSQDSRSHRVFGLGSQVLVEVWILDCTNEGIATDQGWRRPRGGACASRRHSSRQRRYRGDGGCGASGARRARFALQALRVVGVGYCTDPAGWTYRRASPSYSTTLTQSWCGLRSYACSQVHSADGQCKSSFI